MKLKLIPILAAGCLFLLGGCFGIEGQKYAELRIGDAGKSQLLIVADDWGGGLTAEGYRGFKHGVYAWVFLQGDGPVYVNPVIQPNHRPFVASHGTITIDQEHHRVIVDLHRPDINGAYWLTTNHELFYAPETEN